MSWTPGRDGNNATATFAGPFPPETTRITMDDLRKLGYIGGWHWSTAVGGDLIVSWPIGATPNDNPYAGWHGLLLEPIAFGPHDPNADHVRTANLFVDRILYRVCGCKAGKC